MARGRCAPELSVTGSANAAPTARLPASVTVHVPAPVHAPLHPTNCAPAFGCALNVTVPPRVAATWSQRALHTPVGAPAMPPGPVACIRSRHPRTTVIPNPEALTESTSIVRPSTESANDSSGVHIALESFGS